MLAFDLCPFAPQIDTANFLYLKKNMKCNIVYT